MNGGDVRAPYSAGPGRTLPAGPAQAEGGDYGAHLERHGNEDDYAAIGGAVGHCHSLRRYIGGERVAMPDGPTPNDPGLITQRSCRPALVQEIGPSRASGSDRTRCQMESVPPPKDLIHLGGGDDPIHRFGATHAPSTSFLTPPHADSSVTTPTHPSSPVCAFEWLGPPVLLAPPVVLVKGLKVDSSGSANVPMSATQPFVEIRTWVPS
jgi:hypothetical protein